MKTSMTPNLCEVTAAEADYLQAVAAFGSDSAEAYVAEQCWRHLRRRYYQRRQSSRPGGTL